MTKKSNKETESLEEYLKRKMTVTDFNQAPNALGVSKKMFTVMIRNPKKLSSVYIKKLSEITNEPYDMIFQFIEA